MSRLSLARAAIGAVALFAVTFAGARLSGLQPNLPWPLLVLIAVVCLPFAICFTQLAPPDGRRVPSVLANWPVCIAFAIAVLLGWHHFPVWPVLALVLWLVPWTRYTLVNRHDLALATTILIGGYGVVWNANYLLLRHMPAPRWDPVMRELDLVFYRWWYGPGVNLTAMFPLVDAPLVLRAFDNSYALLIPEVVLVAFLLTQRRRDAVGVFLGRLFACYAAGIAIYAVFPVNGPHLYYPEQQDLSRSLESTVAFANGMMHDYRVAQTGGALTGFGYFIAVPSLHVMVAVLLQHCLYSFPVLFRIFLPVNIMLCLRTVVLGYHYIADIGAALAVYAVLVAATHLRGGMPTHRLGARPEQQVAAV